MERIYYRREFLSLSEALSSFVDGWIERMNFTLKGRRTEILAFQMRREKKTDSKEEKRKKIMTLYFCHAAVSVPSC